MAPFGVPVWFGKQIVCNPTESLTSRTLAQSAAQAAWELLCCHDRTWHCCVLGQIHWILSLCLTATFFFFSFCNSSKFKLHPKVRDSQAWDSSCCTFYRLLTQIPFNWEKEIVCCFWPGLPGSNQIEVRELSICNNRWILSSWYLLFAF